MRRSPRLVSLKATVAIGGRSDTGGGSDSLSRGNLSAPHVNVDAFAYPDSPQWQRPLAGEGWATHILWGAFALKERVDEVD